MIRRPPSSPLFPYPTLFRSAAAAALVGLWVVVERPALSKPPRNMLATAAVSAKAVQAASGTEVVAGSKSRSEEHTSELQSQSNLVCRLLLEKKNTQPTDPTSIGARGGGALDPAFSSMASRLAACPQTPSTLLLVVLPTVSWKRTLGSPPLHA